MPAHKSQTSLSEAEYNARNFALEEKYDRGDKLTEGEQYELCDHWRTDLLLQIPFCHDEFYERYYLNRSDPHPLLGKFEQRHEDYFRRFVREWKEVVRKQNHTDPFVKLIAEETRKELKAHRKAMNPLHPKFSEQKYREEEFDIIAWSKYRYLLIKRAYFEMGRKPFRLSLNGKEIFYTDFSLIHVSTRHFGEVMKRYPTDKDHFHAHFYFTNMHLGLQDVFGRFDNSGVYVGQSVEEINFRFAGKLYKVYCNEWVMQQKCVPDKKTLRVNTFFPIGNEQMLKRLEDEFTEVKIDDELAVFVKTHP